MIDPDSIRGTSVAVVLLAAAACGSEAELQTSEARASEPGRHAAVTGVGRGEVANSAGTDGVDDRPLRRETERDRNFLQMAEEACTKQDFKSFLWAFSASWLVQARYTAAQVNFGVSGASRAMPRQRYLDQNNFPFAPLDNDYVTAEVARAFDADPDFDWRKIRYAQLEFNTASDKRQRVDWVTGIFERNLDPPPEYLEEGLGELVQPVGSGYVLFEPTTTCWNLTQDVSIPLQEP